MATTVPTVVDGDDFTDDFTLAVKAAIDELQALAPTTASATGSGIVTGTNIRALRLPFDGGASVLLFGSLQNSKGSNLAGGDDLFTLPAGFRPAGTNSNLIAVNLNTLALVTFNLSTAGLAEFANGAVANGSFLRIFQVFNQ